MKTKIVTFTDHEIRQQIGEFMGIMPVKRTPRSELLTMCDKLGINLPKKKEVSA